MFTTAGLQAFGRNFGTPSTVGGKVFPPSGNAGEQRPGSVGHTVRRSPRAGAVAGVTVPTTANSHAFIRRHTTRLRTDHVVSCGACVGL